jgi:hypothetical protein
VTDVPPQLLTTPGPHPISAVRPQTPTIVIPRGAPQALVTIHPDGTIEFGPGYTPEGAAALFWDALRQVAAGNPIAEFGAPLSRRIDAEMAGLLARAEEAEAMLAAVRAKATAAGLHGILALLDPPPPACPRCHGRGKVPDWSQGLDPIYGEPKGKPCPDCQETPA